jgi:hypothetical protein
MTRYEIERAPGDNTAGWRVVAINKVRQGWHASPRYIEERRPYCTWFAKQADAEADAQRLRDRDALILAGAGFPRGAA